LPIRLGEKRELSYRILPLAAPTTLQKQIHADWLK
jgi:hypothetical protein